jgi:glycerol-3-phosphate dehydrogenase
MRHIDTEVLVIGGGATGTGVIRDLSMRGFKTVLVEKRDLAHGTTGRYHGLLHSGGRYVVKDTLAARECIQENIILKKIIPQCIEDTGGFFVLTPWDEPEYASRFLSGCQQVGIPVEEFPVSEMLRQEPLLNPGITRCFRVPDASADSFLAADLHANAARQLGAQILTYHEVNRLLTDADPQASNKGIRRVTGALCFDLLTGEEVSITADIVVNASGAWAGKISATAGIEIQIHPGKGIMLAVNHRIVNTVINRCKIPADGDIIVPAHTVAVIGTTDEQVSDPDRYAIEPWEIKLMLDEGEKLIPGFKELRILRAWAGVRPLFQEADTHASRDITRAYVLLDHAQRDGVEGLVTITSGKWTTFRKMAEVTVDKVCEKLKVNRACRTHLEVLPTLDHHHHTLGARLTNIEKDKHFRELICECELATFQEVEKAILVGKANTIDDIRRDTRLGMGPCQGGFCTLRATGILHELRQIPVVQANTALHDFLQERWKGLQPILWGQQLRQERLDELVYLNVLNAGHLPGSYQSNLSAEPYAQSKVNSLQLPLENQYALPSLQTSISQNDPLKADILVIGAGLSGLTAAWRAALSGKRVRLISKGAGAHYWGAGSIDILGYVSPERNVILQNLNRSLEELIQINPHHPYAISGKERLEEALKAFQDLCNASGYPLQGSIEKNWLLPTALGTLRPTCLAPETMLAGDVADPKPMIIVGFDRYYDFFPGLIAANLEVQGLTASGIKLDLPMLRDRKTVTSRILAQYFENPDFRAEFVKTLKSKLGGLVRPGQEIRFGFPAVLGLKDSWQVWKDLSEQLEQSVFEIPGLPPSIPGMRLHQILCQAVQWAGGVIYEGMQVVKVDCASDHIQTIWSEAAARQKPHQARHFVLASGGFLGGGLVASSDDILTETIFDLPVQYPFAGKKWWQDRFIAETGQPIFQSGILVDNNFCPINSHNKPMFENLSVIGSNLAHVDPIQERSLEGIALVTGFSVGEMLGMTL